MIETLNKHHETVNYTCIDGIRLYHNDIDDCFPPHWHKEAELIMPLSNTYDVQIGLSGQIHRIYENQILILPPGGMHTILAPSYGERLIINLDLNLYTDLKGFGLLFNTLSPYRIIKEECNPLLFHKLRSHLFQIQDEYNSGDLYCDALIRSLFTSFFVTLGRQDAINHVSNQYKIEQKIQYAEKFADVCYYISTHCTESVSMEQAASQIGFSKYHFCRLFKEFVGCTFHEYVTSCRLSHAQRLLACESVAITEAALLSGFTSLATFNRIFKEKQHCTPSEYRKLLRHSTC